MVDKLIPDRTHIGSVKQVFQKVSSILSKLQDLVLSIKPEARTEQRETNTMNENGLEDRFRFRFEVLF